MRVLVAALILVASVAGAQPIPPTSVTLVASWSDERPPSIIRLQHVEFGEDAAILFTGRSGAPHRVTLTETTPGIPEREVTEGTVAAGTIGYRFGRLDAGRYRVEVEDIGGVCPPASVQPARCSRFLVFQVLGELPAPTRVRILPVDPPPLDPSR